MESVEFEKQCQVEHLDIVETQFGLVVTMKILGECGQVWNATYPLTTLPELMRLSGLKHFSRLQTETIPFVMQMKKERQGRHFLGIGTKDRYVAPMPSGAIVASEVPELAAPCTCGKRDLVETTA